MLCFTTRCSRLKPALMACAAGLSLFTSPAYAQNAQVDSTKLLELMVAKGLVTRAEADQLIAQATVPPQQQAAIPAGGVSGDTQTIPYIPQTVRNQLKEELRTELANQAAREGWARPGEVAEWTKRITLFGDLRVRGEGTFMDKGNFDLAFPNFTAINAGPGYDVSPSNPNAAPFLNSTRDRHSARIRARFGLKARIDDWIGAEVRLATGNDRSPVSTNQNLGANGEFGKYAVWLDRANIRLNPVKDVDLVFGRFANPFWTSEILFDEDINFDGLAASVRAPVGDRLQLFANAGAFPIFNTDFNFGSNEAGAFSSKDKYLFAGQIGAQFKPVDTVAVQLAAGYFRFDNVQGRTSSPCFFDQDVCDTDATRPQFLQFGNSLFPIRNIVPDTADPIGSPNPQYYGLASKYEILNVHGRVDYTGFGSIGVRLEGDYVNNLGYDRRTVAARAINNLGPGTNVPNPTQDNNPATNDATIYNPGPYAGGNTGWMANLTVGKPDMIDVGDWRLSLGYRRVKSDAVLDAFADSDFHLGGTNAKGWTIGGGYTFGNNTALSARWLSSDTISGIPFSNDIVQIDLTTKF
ncbi:putative porin [Sphingomonas sp. PB4P5]|uniref:putative porin n=1 Tax=Parasphingomonas puruogangriensis TaxID=3096155 RepID=UPI002FC7F64D